MIRNKGISLLIPILFLAMLALILSVPQEEAFSQIRFQAESSELSLTPWYHEGEDRYYLFLPSFLSQDDLSPAHPWYIRYEASWKGEEKSMPLDQDITVKASFLFGRHRTYTLRLLHCSAERTICIDAKEGTLEYLHADQGREKNVYITFWNQSGLREYEGKTAMSGRGNSTWEWDKKPYNLEFPNPIAVGPFVEIQKLCLLAEFYDLTMMRNAAAYRTAQMLDFPYASPYIYADLFVNGEYLGLYGITTKQEYTKHIAEDGIQAVFELSTSGKGQEFYTDTGKPIRVRYGSEDLIRYKVEAMESALEAQDPDALRQHIDLSSWAKKYAMDELFYNYDLSLTSEYFYLDPEGLIRCMLPWDYEWILYPRMYPHTMETEYALCGYYNLPSWYSALLELEPFREAVREAYDSTYTDDFFGELREYLKSCEEEIRDSWLNDQLRWWDAYQAVHKLSPGSISLSQQSDSLLSGLSLRLAFLKNLFHHWEDYCLITFWSDLDGEITPFKLQLIAPKGDFTPYHEPIQKSVYAPAGCQMLGVYTEDGVPLEEITVITEDTPLYVRSISSQEEVNHE